MQVAEVANMAYRTSNNTSFAYLSVKDRWPVIVTGAIDDMHRALYKCEFDEQRIEGKTILEGLANLKYEIEHNRDLIPLDEDGKPDISDYNRELAELADVQWFSAPWLFAECYMYRRIHTLFSTSILWKDYDVFSRQKLATFRSSRPAVLELAAKYKAIIEQLQKGEVIQNEAAREEAEQILFTEMCEICLWGNATDLSLLTNMTYDDIQKLQGADARKNAEKNILVNDLPAAYKVLNEARKKDFKADRRVDIVLDNAGFELYVDLILAGYLLAAGLATQIVLHPKSIPWFVSDVIPQDFVALLDVLNDPQQFYAPVEDKDANGNAEPLTETEVSNLVFLFQHWAMCQTEGQLLIRPNLFWTSYMSYWEIPQQKYLYDDLKESELVIFKGDLNYRKLTVDAEWPPTTPFKTAIHAIGPTSNLRILALRTCKADVVVGLPEGEDERLKTMEGGGGDSGARKWAWSGKWAVVQFYDGKL